MQELLEKLRRRTEAAEMFVQDTTVNLVGFENSKLKSLNTLNSRGAAVRAIAKGRLGQAIVSNFRSPDAIATRIQLLAELGDPCSFQFTGPSTYPQLQLIDERVAAMSVSDIIQDGQEALDLINQYDSHVMTTFIAERSLDRIQVLTTNGADAGYERLYYSYGILTKLVEEQNILKITKYARGIARPASARETAATVVDYLRVGRRTLPFQPGKLQVILAPSALADVLMAFTGSVDGELVAKGVSPMSKRLGEQVLDARITIWDDPWHPNGIMSAPNDDEGTPTRRTALIENGVLNAFITDRKASVTLQQPPSGNGYRAVPFERYKSFGVGLAIDFSNLVMAPGKTSLDAMRCDMGAGIEVHQINGILLGDLIGGDFSGSLETAFLVQNGERIGRVKNAMISGNFFELFKNHLVDLSIEQEWSGTFGGCSGAFLLPYVYAQDVEISGTSR